MDPTVLPCKTKFRIAWCACAPQNTSTIHLGYCLAISCVVVARVFANWEIQVFVIMLVRQFQFVGCCFSGGPGVWVLQGEIFCPLPFHANLQVEVEGHWHKWQIYWFSFKQWPERFQGPIQPICWLSLCLNCHSWMKERRKLVWTCLQAPDIISLLKCKSNTEIDR